MIHKFPAKPKPPSDANPRYASGTSLIKTEKEELRDQLCDILQVDELEAIIENNLAKASNWTIKRLIQHIERRIQNERYTILNTNGVAKDSIPRKQIE